MKEKIESSLEFLRIFCGLSEDVVDVINYLKEHDEKFKSVSAYHSGGGCGHLALGLPDGHILILHTDCGDLEKSYKKYESADDYLTNKDDEDDETGFGWEYDAPNWDDRYCSTQDLDKAKEFIIKSIG